MTAAWYRATVYLNTGRWQEAADAAQQVRALWPAAGFIEAFAHFELARREDVLETFLHAALNHPGAARMLTGERADRAPTPKSREEAEDHNTGVSLLRSLHGYLRGGQPKMSRQFFREIIADARVARLLDESAAVVGSWHEQHRTGEREAFDRMQLMRSLDFATAEAAKLRDLVAIPGLHGITTH